MFGKVWYHQLIRKYVICLGTLFNDISITRTEEFDPTTPTTQLIKVPITYSPKEKMLSRIFQDPNIDRPSATITLPVISFEMGKISYDKDRKLNSIGKISHTQSDGTTKSVYNPVAYNFNFKVYVYTKNTEDGTKIIEQILPYFTPVFTMTVNLIPEMGITMDIPITLNNVDYEDTYTGDFKQRRAIIWTLDFTLKGYFFGPTKERPVIKFMQTNIQMPNGAVDCIGDAVGNSVMLGKITVQPGLTANGQPTSNLASTVPYININPNNDYGYITTVNTFSSNTWI